MSGDFQDWIPESKSSHAAPPSVTKIYRKREVRGGALKLAFWTAVLLGCVGAAIWEILR